MPDFVDLAYGAAFIAVSVVLALGTCLLARRVAAPRMGEDTVGLADSMVFRIGALHGLILALVFAQELLQYQRLSNTVTLEAAAVADAFYELDRYGTLEAPALRDALRRYVALAAGAEWAALAERDTLLPEAWEAWEAVYVAALDFTPETLRQDTLRTEILRRLQDIAQFRDTREAAALYTIGPPFWFAAFTGMILVVLPYFRFTPSALNFTLLGLFAGYSGLVLSFIYAFSDPFSPPGRLEPVMFHRLAAEIGAPEGLTLTPP